MMTELLILGELPLIYIYIYIYIYFFLFTLIILLFPVLILQSSPYNKQAFSYTSKLNIGFMEVKIILKRLNQPERTQPIQV